MDSTGRSIVFEGFGIEAAPFKVFALEDRVADNRDIEASRSRTNVLLSGSYTSTCSFAFVSCSGPLNI